MNEKNHFYFVLELYNCKILRSNFLRFYPLLYSIYFFICFTILINYFRLLVFSPRRIEKIYLNILQSEDVWISDYVNLFQVLYYLCENIRQPSRNDTYERFNLVFHILYFVIFWMIHQGWRISTFCYNFLEEI